MSGPPPIYHHGQHVGGASTHVVTPTGGPSLAPSPHALTTPTGASLVPPPNAMMIPAGHAVQRHSVAMPTGYQATMHPVGTPSPVAPVHSPMSTGPRMVGLQAGSGLHYSQHQGYAMEVISRTIERLSAFRHHLTNPGGFCSVVKALLEWIMNPRSFIAQCEPNLLGCLDSIYRLALSPGFDLELGHRLMSTCLHIRHLLSEKASMLITRWHDDLNKGMLSRQQRMMSMSMSPQSQVYLSEQQPVNEMSFVPQQSYGQQGNSHQSPSVSVVTNFYNMPPGNGYQSGPSPMTSYPQNQVYRNPAQGMYTGTQQQQQQQYQQQQQHDQIIAQAIVSTSTATVMTTAKVQPHPPMGEMVNGIPTPSSSATTTAAVTCHQGSGLGGGGGGLATTTTTAANQVVHQPHSTQGTAATPPAPTPFPSYQSPGHQMPSAAPVPLSRPGSLPLRGGDHAPSQAPPTIQDSVPLGSRLSGCSPAPQSAVVELSYQATPTGQPGDIPSVLNSPMVHSPYTPQHSQPQVQIHSHPGTPLHHPGTPLQHPGTPLQHPGTPPYHPGTPQPVHYYQTTTPSPHPQPLPPHHPHHSQPYHHQANMAAPYHHPHPASTLGSHTVHTPTHSSVDASPLYHHSPGSVGGHPPSPHPSSHLDTVYYAMDPHHMLRLTFPLKESNLLRPFKLPHGITHSEHPFQLNEKIHPVLLERFDLEIQLNCYHDNDRQEICNWPQGVSVHINNKPVSISVEGQRNLLHRPLHIKRLCQPGHNILRISATQCCCSHFFVLQLVHRPSVKNLLQNILQQRKLPENVCKDKMRKMFSGGGAEDGVQQTCTNVTLKCPITYRRIAIPARGTSCQHIQCFDLESYLQMNCDRSTWKCPVCGQPAALQCLEIDCYLWSILNNSRNGVEEVEDISFDQDANWTPISKALSPEADSEDGPQEKKPRLSSPRADLSVKSEALAQMSPPLSVPASNQASTNTNSSTAVLGPQVTTTTVTEAHSTLSSHSTSTSSLPAAVDPAPSQPPAHSTAQQPPPQLSQTTATMHGKPYYVSAAQQLSAAGTEYFRAGGGGGGGGNSFMPVEDSDYSFLESLPDANELLQALGNNFEQDQLTVPSGAI